MNLVYCEKYSCKLLPDACVARYRMAQKPYESARGPIGKHLSQDPGCVNCAVGKARAADALNVGLKEGQVEVDKNIDVDSVIADACGRFGVSVEEMMARKARGGKYSVARKEIYLRLRDMGMKNKEISKILNISAQAIDQWALSEKTDAAPPPEEPPPYPQIDVSRIGDRHAASPRPLICLDFAEYRGLYDRIFAIARDEMRTPENQILYWLRGYLKDAV